MAFLTINDFEVSILDGSASISEEEIGSSSRAFSGHLLQSTRARARVFSGKTPILSSADAKALVGLLKADGHMWAFNDQYSSKGAGPLPGGTYSITSGELIVASDENATFDTNIGSVWSIAAYDAANGFACSLDSNGTQYNSGSTTTGVDYLFQVSSGDLNIAGQDTSGNPAVAVWTYVAILPFVFTTAMHEVFSDLAIFSELPSLTVSGSALKSESVTMRLRHGSLSETQVQYMSGGSITTGFEISFTLEEVL